MLAAIGGGPIDPDDPVAQMISAAVDHYAVTLPLPQRLTAAQLGGLRMPVYAALAGRSAMHDGARAADVARAAVPGATVTFWPAATHSLPLEQAVPLDRMILDLMAPTTGALARGRCTLARSEEVWLVASSNIVLVGVDGSPQSGAALKYAVAEANRRGARLRVVSTYFPEYAVHGRTEPLSAGEPAIESDVEAADPADGRGGAGRRRRGAAGGHRGCGRTCCRGAHRHVGRGRCAGRGPSRSRWLRQHAARVGRSAVRVACPLPRDRGAPDRGGE